MARRDYNTTPAEVAELWALWDTHVTVKETITMQETADPQDPEGKTFLSTRLSERQLGRLHSEWAKDRKKYPMPRLREEFHWPQDIGARNDQIPFELSQYTTRCMEFYLDEFETWPRIGLVKRFAEVAAAQPLWDNSQTAVFAELLWYADLIGSTPGDREKGTTLNRPNTRHIELCVMTNQSDKISLLADKYQIPDEVKIEGQWEGWLPLYAATRHETPERMKMQR